MIDATANKTDAKTANPIVENNTVNNTINELPAKKALNTNITSTLLSSDLMKHEKGIRTAQKAFYTIGENLNHITKHGLYQERGFNTFEMYVDLMFDMSRGYAYKMMDAFRVKTVLLAYGFKAAQLPKTESQCRVLVKLIEKDAENVDLGLKAVWTEVLSAGKITAKSISISVDKHQGKSVIVRKPGNTNLTDGTNDEPKDTPIVPAPEVETDEDGLPVESTVSDSEPLQASPSNTQQLIDSIKEKNSEILRLKSELAKAQTFGKTGEATKKSKLEIEFIKAGFKAMAASTSPENMPELIKIKDTYLA